MAKQKPQKEFFKVPDSEEVDQAMAEIEADDSDEQQPEQKEKQSSESKKEIKNHHKFDKFKKGNK